MNFLQRGDNSVRHVLAREPVQRRGEHVCIAERSDIRHRQPECVTSRHRSPQANARQKMDDQRPEARFIFFSPTFSISSTTLNRRSTSATIRVCSAKGGRGNRMDERMCWFKKSLVLPLQ